MGYRVYCKNGNVKLIKWVLVIQNAYIYIYIYWRSWWECTNNSSCHSKAKIKFIV